MREPRVAVGELLEVVVREQRRLRGRAGYLVRVRVRARARARARARVSLPRTLLETELAYGAEQRVDVLYRWAGGG